MNKIWDRNPLRSLAVVTGMKKLMTLRNLHSRLLKKII